MNPDVVEKDKNMALSNAIRMQSRQLRALFFDDEYDAFVNNVGYLIGDDDFKMADVLFGTDLNGRDYNNLAVDVSDGVNLSNVMGIRLQNGSNGSFGDRPIKAKEYEAELIKASTVLSPMIFMTWITTVLTVFSMLTIQNQLNVLLNN